MKLSYATAEVLDAVPLIETVTVQASRLPPWWVLIGLGLGFVYAFR